jgi:chloramphenicol O-acetyltransferase type A
MKYRKIDLETWPRRSHFDFFNAMNHPWFDMCNTVDVTLPWTLCHAQGGPSFFAATLFLALGAANSVEEMRTRIRGEEVVIHDRLNAGSTMMRDDETFGFGFVDANDDFSAFAAATAAETARIHLESGILVDREIDDVVHFSVLPWISFTSIGHPRHLGWTDSIPKIVIGRCKEYESKWLMPVALSVHHSLVDGLHASRFYANFQERCDQAEALLV